MKCFAAIAFITLLANGMWAQEPQVRARLELKGDPWVGQKVTLVVELLVPGYFSGSPSFDLPRIPGMLMIPPEGSPVVSTEQVGDKSYTVQRHELAVFAQRAGAREIPSFAVRFGFKRSPLDKDALQQRVMTPPLQFTAKLPPGSEKLGAILSARNLEVKESWQPEPGKTKAKAGDAFQRTILYSAPDVLGMAFPPFPTQEMDGLGIYPKAPVVQDRSDRGAMTGERRETITYLCKREGHFVIPPVRLTWWDLDALQLRVIDFPARAFEVAPNPALASAATAATGAKPPRHVWPWIVSCLALLTLLGLLFRNSLHQAAAGAIAFFRPVHLQPLNPLPTSQPSNLPR